MEDPFSHLSIAFLASLYATCIHTHANALIQYKSTINFFLTLTHTMMIYTQNTYHNMSSMSLSLSLSIYIYIYNSVWNELEKENKEFFEAYEQSQSKEDKMSEEETSQMIQKMISDSSKDSDD